VPQDLSNNHDQSTRWLHLIFAKITGIDLLLVLTLMLGLAPRILVLPKQTGSDFKTLLLLLTHHIGLDVERAPSLARIPSID